MEGYVTFKELASALGFKRAYRIYDWDTRGCIQSTIVNGVKCVTKEFTDKLVDIWSKTYTPAETARALGIKSRGGTIGHLIKGQVLETIDPFGSNFKGYTRVVIESIPRAKKYVDEKEVRQKKLGSSVGKSGMGHKFNSEEARLVSSMRWVKLKKLKSICKIS